MVKKYIIRLSQEERSLLASIVKKLKGTSQKVQRAHILLKADVDGPSWFDAKIAEALSCRTRTIENVRRRLVTEGLDAVLNREKRKTPPTPSLPRAWGAFYEAFDARKARELVRRIAFHYTPKHGSWLNIAENELSSMTRQSISGRRIENIQMLRTETSAWANASNEKQRGIDWQFTVEKARIKLKSLYPNL